MVFSPNLSYSTCTFLQSRFSMHCVMNNPIFMTWSPLFSKKISINILLDTQRINRCCFILKLHDA